MSSSQTHICIDARMINNSGIGVYIEHYTAYLLATRNYKLSLIGRFSELSHKLGTKHLWDHIEAEFPIYSVKEQTKLPRLIPPCDVFWSPHYNIPLAPIQAKKRLVTVPDVFHLAHLESLTFAQKVYAKVLTNAAVRLSDQVTTISTFSKKEIIKHTGIDEKKVVSILLGINKDLYKPQPDYSLKDAVANRYSLPDNYILFVGNVKPNKNLNALVNVLPRLCSQYPDLHLVIVGKKEGFIMQDQSLFAEINSNKLLQDRVRFTGYVATEHLPVIYAMANVFAFPSLYEGFGFPPLEAMACGCPVAASNRASIPEICGDAAIYFNPQQPDSIVEEISRLLINQNLRAEMTEKGFAKVKQYDWIDSQKQFEQEIKKLS